jgi:hypothetical protein
MEMSRQRAAKVLGGISFTDRGHEYAEKWEARPFILSLMDGKTALDEIAHQLTALYPTHFSTYNSALDHVSELAQKYSR